MPASPEGRDLSVVGALAYWIEQHDVQRGGQPIYYYVLLMGLYEFLTVVLAVARCSGGAAHARAGADHRLFLLLVFGYFLLGRPGGMNLGERESTGWFLLGLTYAADAGAVPAAGAAACSSGSRCTGSSALRDLLAGRREDAVAAAAPGDAAGAAGARAGWATGRVESAAR